MNICFIATEIVPSKNGAFTGGLVNNVVRFARGLSENGHNIEIMTTDVNMSLNQKTNKYEWGTINLVQVGGKYVSLQSNIKFLVKIIPAIRKLDKKNRIDLIHVHSAYSVFGIVASLASIVLRKPVVFTLYSPLHNKPLKDRKGFYQSLSSGIFNRIFLLKAGTITCISQNIKQSLVDAKISKDIYIIPPMINSAHFNPYLDGAPVRKELGIPQNAKVILYCGSWAKWKGVDLLIKAFHEVKKRFPESFLITAWGEPYDWYDERKTQLSEMIDSLGLKSSVVELGVVKDINMVMAASDIFVAPFLNIDGVADPPLSILEAMACGKIVVATKIASIPQIIDDGVTGLLVSPGNLDELKIVLEKALNDFSVNDKIGINAADYVLKNYGTYAVVNQVMNVYDDIRRKSK